MRVRTYGRIDSAFCLSTGAADSTAALEVAADGCEGFAAVLASETPLPWCLLSDLPPRPFRRSSGELVAAKGACELQSQGDCNKIHRKMRRQAKSARQKDLCSPGL